jgi:hypothetical protein
MPDLLATGKIVVAECYPTEVYSHLGLPRRFGKGRAEARVAQAPRLLVWCHDRQVRLAPDLKSSIETGFDNDDAFDAFIGLLGLVEVARGEAPDTAPPRWEILEVEGWILGMRPHG